ncbi:MAG: pentapeptide repeat-containing protein [Chlorobi bacterium]|nr:pentapeptide repeat-containing protein [Chlorobiota bacterium]
MKPKNTDLTENRTFENEVFDAGNQLSGSYEECLFFGCGFTGAELSGVTFRDCTFEMCDFTLAGMKNVALQQVLFRQCKLQGVQFGECRTFLLELRFEECLMRFSTFLKLSLKETVFRKCDLQEADFTEADLTGASFGESDLMKAVFQHTNLEKADFRTALNYSINPETNRLRKARFSLPGITGLLDTYGIEIE